MTTTATTTTIASARRTMTTVGPTEVPPSGQKAVASIPDELYPGEETEGEWEGCYLKFLSPISVGSRGVGE